MVRSRDPLVGRLVELDVLDEALEAVADGQSAAFVIAGAPGIGKSRLLAEVADRAGSQGHLVLTGSGSELERDAPFGVFVDAIDEYVESVDPRRLSRLPEDVRAELSRVFPSLSGWSEDGGQAPQTERYRTHRAVRSLLETLASTPLVLVLDDFHWADPASVELGGALLRRPPAARVLMILGVRPRQLAPSLQAELGRAQRDGGITQLDLDTLSFEEAQELLGNGEVPPQAAAALYEESGGVPFYLQQLARVRSHDGTAPAKAAAPLTLGTAEVPPMVVAALSEELTLLSEPAHLVLQGAAVAGDPFEPDLAAAAAGVAEAPALDALDELLRLDFVRPTDVPRRFRFRHPLVRRALYESCPAGWRLAAHERSAAALADRQASAGVRAHHVERSARQGDAAAIALLREAGEAAAERAPSSAARWFEGALRLLADDAPPEERAELLLARAQALMVVGHLRESHEALEESLAMADATSLRLRTRLVSTCAKVERLLGLQEQASERLLRAAEHVPADSPEAIVFAIELAMDGFFRMTFDEMHVWVARAVADAEALGDRPLLAASHAMAALAGAWTGNVEHADAARALATQLVDGLTDAELARRLDSVVNLSMAECYLDRYPESARHAERGMAIGRATGQSELFPTLYAVLGTAWWVEGRLAEAADLYDGAVEAARLLDDAQGIAWMLFNRAAIATSRGEVECALECAEESVELTADFDEGVVKAYCGLFFGFATLEAGDPERAAELMVTSCGGEELPLLPGGWRVLYLDMLTRARIEAGDSDGATRSAGFARAWADQVGLPYAAAMADRAQARAALAEGDFIAAAERALAAAQQADAIGARLDAAVARSVAAQALGASGERDGAVEQLTAAIEVFSDCGAVRHREAANQELRRLGEYAQRRTRRAGAAGDGLDSLTGRELEVARLTVERMTNREMAARLFLSEKTIETHMRNLFHKLGVTSRVEVARAMERADRRAARDR